MSKARTAIVLTLLAATAAVSATPAVAQSPASWPHSRIVTYDRGDVLIRRLQMAVTRTNGRLNAELSLTVRNDSNRLLHRELQVGRCTGGAALALVCPASVRIPVRLPAHQQRRVNRTFTLRQPPARTDSIQAALVRPGTRQPFGVHTDGALLLRGGAWRGVGAGRTYGVVLGPLDRARRLNFDIPNIGGDRAYIDVKWQGPMAPSGATTTIARCASAVCTPRTLVPAAPAAARSSSATASTSPAGTRRPWRCARRRPRGSTCSRPSCPVRPPSRGGRAPAQSNRRICTHARLGRRIPAARTDRRSLVGR
jgi:hypothetical protein